MASKGQTNIKRKDKNRIVLRKGESQRANGTYDFRWFDVDGKRKTIYAKTLDELRKKEEEVLKCVEDGIKSDGENITVSEMFFRWFKTKGLLKNRTKITYMSNYGAYIKPYLADKKISKLKKSDILLYYNMLVNEHGIQLTTLCNVNQIINQVFELAVDDRLIRSNPARKGYKEFKKQRENIPNKKTGLTIEEQEAWLKFLKYNPKYKNLYPIVAVMVGTGMRIGEVSGLRWEDIDLDKGVINVSHAMSFSTKVTDCGDIELDTGYAVGTTKSLSSERTIQMLDSVKEAFILELEEQEKTGRKCNAEINGFTNFIFCDNKLNACTSNYVNRRIKNSVSDFNSRAKMLSNETGVPQLELPHITCHTLRHSFTNRMCEAGVNIKLMQSVLGHKDVSTTLNVYADATPQLTNDNFDILQNYIDSHYILRH